MYTFTHLYSMWKHFLMFAMWVPHKSQKFIRRPYCNITSVCTAAMAWGLSKENFKRSSTECTVPAGVQNEGNFWQKKWPNCRLFLWGKIKQSIAKNSSDLLVLSLNLHMPLTLWVIWPSMHTLILNERPSSLRSFLQCCQRDLWAPKWLKLHQGKRERMHFTPPLLPVAPLNFSR